MKLSRRRFLGSAAALGAPALLPLSVLADPAAARADAAVSPGRLRILVDADELGPPIRRGIESSLAALGPAQISLVTIEPALVQGRLDRLVERLQEWRGDILLGAIAARRALLLEEALAELGVAWISRGEDVQSGDSVSRHRLVGSVVRTGELRLERFAGTQAASAPRWAESLGRGMVVRALAPSSADPLLPVAALDRSAHNLRRLIDTSPRPPSAHLISLITRI